MLCHLQAVLVQPICSGTSSFDTAASAASLQHKQLTPRGHSLIKETLALNIMANIILDVKDKENFLNPINQGEVYGLLSSCVVESSPNTNFKYCPSMTGD